MLKHGDKMYRVSGTKLEAVTFIEEGLSDPSCTITTYLLRDLNGHKFRCSKSMYFKTPKEAWKDHLKNCRESYEPTVKAVEEAQKQLDWLILEIDRVDLIVKEFELIEEEE